MERKEIIRQCISRGIKSSQIYLCLSLSFTPVECIQQDYDCYGVNRYKKTLANEIEEDEGDEV